MLDGHPAQVECQAVQDVERLAVDCFDRFEDGPLSDLLFLLRGEAAVEPMAIAVKCNIVLRGDPLAELEEARGICRAGIACRRAPLRRCSLSRNQAGRGAGERAM